MSKTKIDWIIHYVIDGVEDTPKDFYSLDGFGNIHTHGLNRYNNQRELCICLAISDKLAASLLNSMGLRVANGETVFTEGIRDDVLQDKYNVKFITFDNDPTLYMILPDSNNKFPGEEGCESPYDKQEIYAQFISENKEYV